ncbi:MAG: hypothetical protein ACPGXK_10940 [Phycisphaerae bacterium]
MKLSEALVASRPFCSAAERLPVIAMTIMVGLVSAMGCVAITDPDMTENGNDSSMQDGSSDDNSMTDDGESAGDGSSDDGSSDDGGTDDGTADDGSGETSMPADGEETEPSTGQGCVDAEQCDDGDACTDDVCEEGSCVNIARCDPDDEECVEGECVPIG